MTILSDAESPSRAVYHKRITKYSMFSCLRMNSAYHTNALKCLTIFVSGHTALNSPADSNHHQLNSMLMPIAYRPTEVMFRLVYNSCRMLVSAYPGEQCVQRYQRKSGVSEFDAINERN